MLGWDDLHHRLIGCYHISQFHLRPTGRLGGYSNYNSVYRLLDLVYTRPLLSQPHIDDKWNLLKGSDLHKYAVTSILPYQTIVYLTDVTKK